MAEKKVKIRKTFPRLSHNVLYTCGSIPHVLYRRRYECDIYDHALMERRLSERGSPTHVADYQQLKLREESGRAMSVARPNERMHGG